MKNEKKVSLTSKERKDLRRAGETDRALITCAGCGNKIVVPHGKIVACDVCGASVSNIPEAAAAAADIQPGVVEASGGNIALSRRNVYLIIIAAVLAAVLITFAILIPTVFMRNARYAAYDNSVAVIHLSTGDKIELEIFEKEVPLAATNFLYLARNGFFDGVIVFDTTNKYVRFGQYEDVSFETGTHRATNTVFTDKLTDITIPSGSTTQANGSKLAYRIGKDFTSADPNSPKLVDQSAVRGFLSQTYSISGVDFQFCTASNEQQNVLNRKPGDTRATRNMTGYAFGRCINQSSLEALDKIAAMEQMQKPGEYAVHKFWNPPQYAKDPKKNSDVLTAVTIKKVEIVKWHDHWNKWRNFNWDDYFNKNAEGAIGSGKATWYSGPGIEAKG
ncbi:MAG: peptidylprolyl isomerase [Firmicutes bacterium]|nr:peptidylprolyl isomerase [Bacillota bacterium]